mmetsp:Transcript_16547/g.15889  ORF Transcript_16547/g.15889 Transcript_16547/m.15889 type:complete len:333 (+) Transcript_16547:86-1084(+)
MNICVIVFCALSYFTQGFVPNIKNFDLRRSFNRYVNAADDPAAVWSPHSVLGLEKEVLNDKDGLNSNVVGNEDKEKKRKDELLRLAAVAMKAEALEQEEKKNETAKKDNVNMREMLGSQKSGVGELLSLDDLSPPMLNEDTDAFKETQVKPTESESKGGSGVQDMLDTIITMLAKAPLPILRKLITKYQPSLLPPSDTVKLKLEDTVLQIHLNAGLEALWSASGGDWEKLMKTVHQELGQQVLETSAYMRIAVESANDLSESKLKALIKLHGGMDAMPRMKVGSTEAMDKTAYVAAIVDVLRQNNENDYGKVAPILQKELTKGNGKKGFGSN